MSLSILLSFFGEDIATYISSFTESRYKLFLDYKSFKYIKGLFQVKCTSSTYQEYVYEMIKKKQNFYVMKNFDWTKVSKYYLSKYAILIPDILCHTNKYIFRNKTLPKHMINGGSDFNLLIKNPSFTCEDVVSRKKYIDPHLIQYSPNLNVKMISTFCDSDLTFSYGGNIKDPQTRMMVLDYVESPTDFSETLPYSTHPRYRKDVNSNLNLYQDFEETLKNKRLDICKFINLFTDYRNYIDFNEYFIYKHIADHPDLIETLSKEKKFNWSIMSDYLEINEENLKKYPKFKPTHKNKYYRPGDKITNRSYCEYL